ncbi:MAG: hypothetical protein ACOCWA_07265, partial [Bacteroidota bacterium]
RLKLRLNSLFPNRKLNIYLAASIIVLLFSMAFPFKYGFAFLKDLIPPLKQFRALGRFSWMFYYVFTVFTAYLVYIYYRYLKMKDYKILAYILIIFTIGFWSIDAGMNIKFSTRNLFNSNDLLSNSSEQYKNALKDGGVDITRYQAILFLPYANTCGDKLLFEDGMPAFKKAMQCSYHTGLPLIQSFSPRLSFEHALSSIQMLADPAIPKRRLHDMNDKPILVLRTEDELSEQEQWLYDRAHKIMKYENISFAEVDPGFFEKTHAKWQQEARLKIKNLNLHSGVFKTDTLPDLIIYKDFDSFKNSYEVFTGGSSFYLKQGKEFIISTEEFGALPEGKYKVTFWLYVDTRTDNMPEAIFYKWDKEGKQLLREKWNTREEHNIYKNWVRIDEIIETGADYDISLEIKGKYVSLDELLLQPLGSNVYVENNNVHLLNNYPVFF